MCAPMQQAAMSRLLKRSPRKPPPIWPAICIDVHQRHYERCRAQRVAEVLVEVGNEVDHDGGHDKQSGAVAERDQPEGRRPQRFARTEVDRLGLCESRPAVISCRRHGRSDVTVHGEPVVPPAGDG